MRVTYSDGTQASIDQMAQDVATFLAWTAEPELEIRKRMGVKVVLFLTLFAVMLYVMMRRTWAHIKDHPELH